MSTPPYNGTNDLNQWNSAQPNDAVEPGANLGPAVREIKRIVEEVVEKEHNSDGTHASVNGSALVAASVTGDKLALGAVDSTALAAGAVTSINLAADAVTTAAIADDAITADQLAAKAVGVAALDGGATAAQIYVTQAGGAVSLVTPSGDATMDADGKFTVNISSNLAATLFGEILNQNTSGGTLTAATWTQRTLNSTVFDTTGGKVTLSSNVITVQTPGLYMIDASFVSGPNVQLTQVKLQDITVSGTPVDIAFGQIVAAPTGSQVSVPLNTILQITVANTLLQFLQNCQNTVASVGMGTPGNYAKEVYASVRLIKLA